MDKVTIATSSGSLWLTLVAHFGAGLMALAAGVIALSVAKGSTLHKKSGMVFTIAMIFLGLSAAVISAVQGKSGVGAIFTAYLVFTGMTTVRPLRRGGRAVHIALMIIAFAFATGMYWEGAVAWQEPGHVLRGVPAGMIFFLGTVCLLAAIGDARMIFERPLRGGRRLARHLWRMCFGLFIATGSFFIGQAQFVPEPVRLMPLLFPLGVAPLVILLYWMWRIRLRRRLSGLIVGAAPDVAENPG